MKSLRLIATASLLTLVFSLLALGCSPVSAADTPRKILHVKDSGAVPGAADNTDALQAAIDAATAVGGPVELRFAPGAVYRLGKRSLLIENADNLVIDGQEATLLMTNPEIGVLAVQDSTGVAIKNLTVDYDPLPYTQGKIHAVSLADNYFDLKLDDGFNEPDQPYLERAISSSGITVRTTPDGGRRYGPLPRRIERVEKIGERFWRFHARPDSGPNALRNDPPQPGDAYVHPARNHQQAVSGRRCDDLLWENITVLASPGLAFFPHLTSRHTLRDCHVKVKEGRIFSTNADGIHMRGSRGDALIEGCSFEGMGDDAINVHSSALSVREQPAPNQVRVRKNTFSVRPGDELVALRAATVETLGTAIVSSVEDRGADWEITLDRDLPPLKSGANFSESDNLYNLSEAARPFTIRNCRFNDFRGRGILLSALGGVIEHNIFKVREGWGVILFHEASIWSEGPLASDLVIRNNEFLGRGGWQEAAIRSHITTRDGAAVSGNPFHNIRIEDNRFSGYAVPVIDLKYAGDVRITDNTVSGAAGVQRPLENTNDLKLKNCENVTMDGLKITDPNP